MSPEHSELSWSITFLVGAASLSLFLFFASAHIQTIDVAQSVAVSQRIVIDHTVSIIGFPEVAGGGAVRGRGGDLYSTHDIGMALIFVPISALAHLGVISATVATVAYAAVNPLFGAAAVATVHRFAWRLSGRAVAAVQAAFLLAGFTYFLAYARSSFDAVPVAFFLVAAAYATWRGVAAQDLRRVGIAGVLGGAAILVRTDSGVVLAALTVWIACVVARGDKIRTLVVWLAPLAAAAMVNAWFNWLRYEHVLSTGHHDDPQTAFGSGVVTGIAGQLISPGKGVLFFAPPIILVAVGWRRMMRQERSFGWALIGGSVAYFLLFASISNWSGAHAVGPRFVVPLVVLLWSPIAFVLADWHRYGVAARSGLVAVCVVGAFVQVGLATTNDAAIGRMHDQDLQPEAFRSSQIVYSWQAWWDGVQGRAPYSAADWDPLGSGAAPRFDLWWAGASPHIDSSRLTHAVALLLAIAVTTLVVLAMKRAQAVDRTRFGGFDGEARPG